MRERAFMAFFESFPDTGNIHNSYQSPPIDTAFTTAHRILATHLRIDQFDNATKEFLQSLNGYIERDTTKFIARDSHIVISNCIQLLDFADKNNRLMRAISSSPGKDEAIDINQGMNGISIDEATADEHFDRTYALFNATISIVLRRIRDPNVLSFVYVT
ncbi:hypothetical protein F5884DRAFT_143178 [Xylogone sp. PMI_703]|nr:hypothetical protein F5884DRAFT_143178 [Xylogone sp. PMI_703]